MTDPELKRVHLHSQELAYVDRGEGPAIVLIHGLMSSHVAWLPQLEPLSAGHRVIAPDLFGHGASEKPLGDYSLGAHAATVRDLMDALGIDSATIVGHSLGGGIAMQLAYLFPDRVDRLVLVSSGGLGRELNGLLRAATLPGSEFVLPLLSSGPLRDVADLGLRLWSKAGLPALSPSSEEAWRSLATLSDAETRRAFLSSSRSVIDITGQTVSASNKLHALASRPSLLIWGARDRMIPPAHVEVVRREIPAGRIEIFPRSGHFPQLDEPDRFVRVLGEFVAQPLPEKAQPEKIQPEKAQPEKAQPETDELDTQELTAPI